MAPFPARVPRCTFNLMVARATSLIGQGVYSLTEAELLTAIPRQRIRRWMEGYAYQDRGVRKMSPAVIENRIGRSVGELALTFLDLVEVRFLNAFLQHGVSWPNIRLAAEHARDLMGVSHPFSSLKFKTDGKYILVEIARRAKRADLLNLSRNQYEIARIVAPHLHSTLEFDGASITPVAWWPGGKRGGVVLDPQRSFGAPTVAGTGIRTSILAASAAANGLIFAARLFEVTPTAVRKAVAFEKSLRE